MIWEKEDAEREAAGLPDPFAKFTDPLESDFIRARYKWDKEKKIFYMDLVTRNLERILVLILLLPYIELLIKSDYTFINGSCSFSRRSNTGLQPKASLRR
jgi:hypothetical protein